MYKALEVEFIISRKMLIMINGDNKKEAKHESVGIKRTVLDLHGVTVGSKRAVLFEYHVASFILSWKPVEAWSKKLEANLLNTKCDNVQNLANVWKCHWPCHWLRAL